MDINGGYPQCWMNRRLDLYRSIFQYLRYVDVRAKQKSTNRVTNLSPPRALGPGNAEKSDPSAASNTRFTAFLGPGKKIIILSSCCFFKDNLQVCLSMCPTCPINCWGFLQVYPSTNAVILPNRYCEN